MFEKNNVHIYRCEEIIEIHCMEKGCNRFFFVLGKLIRKTKTNMKILVFFKTSFIWFWRVKCETKKQSKNTTPFSIHF